MAARGCGGSRVVGSLYLVTKLVKGGTPLYKFIIDPPIPVPHGLDIPFRGVAIRERPDSNGIYDVYDHVGSEHYPNVLDFVAEVAKLGLSRRVSSKIDFEKITPESRIILVHERAVLVNHAALYRELAKERTAYAGYFEKVAGNFSCLTHREDHVEFAMACDEAAPCCAGVWRQLITGGDDVYDPSVPPRTVKRSVGSTAYRALKAPEKFTPEYQRGFFMSLPLTGVELVKSRDGNKDLDAIERASRAGIPLSLEDE